MSNPSSVNAETVEQTKQQIRGLVSEIAQLSKSDLSPEEYYQAYLQRVVQALAAVGGAIWRLDADGRPGVAYQINMSDTLLETESDDSQRHLALLSRVLQTKEPQLIPPLSGNEEEEYGNPTHFLLVVAPLISDGQLEGVIEIFQRPDSQPATQRGYLRFLIHMSELFGEWLKSRKLKQFSDRHSLWAQADQFARVVHESLDVRETAYTAVNEGRRMIGCDRVSLTIKRGLNHKVEAISGQDTIETRSNIVTTLGKLATRVAMTGEPLWYEGSTEDLPPQIESTLEEYVDESYAKMLIVLPLRKPERGVPDSNTAAAEALVENNQEREIVGALIVEQLETDLPRELIEPRIDLVYEHAARSVSNSIDHNSLFLMPVWKTLGKSRWLVEAKQLPKTLIVGIVVILLLLIMTFVPTDFNIQCEAILQPSIRHEVFAGVNGTVTNLHVTDGQYIEEGDPLVTMVSPELMIEIEKLKQEKESADEGLVVAQQRRSRSIGNMTEAEQIQTAAEISRLAIRSRSLQAQMDELDKKFQQLVIKAPMSGVVMMSWEVQQSLATRPVQAGNLLMTIADTSDEAEWELELHMPERRMGHVNRWMSASVDNENPEVTYVMATDPKTRLSCTVKSVHEATEVLGEQTIVKITATGITKDDFKEEPKPGATAMAAVHCGKASVGYSWFHEAVDWVRLKMFEYLF